MPEDDPGLVLDVSYDQYRAPVYCLSLNNKEAPYMSITLSGPDVFKLLSLLDDNGVIEQWEKYGVRRRN